MDEPEIIKFPFRIQNISMMNTNIPKAHYWEYLNFHGLNKALENYSSPITHELSMPVMPLNSQPIQIQLFLASVYHEDFVVTIKREKLCDCEAIETQVNINKFKKIYHCPHRLLLSITPELFGIFPNDFTELAMNVTFGTFGQTKLRFEIRTSNGCLLYLNFNIHIVLFDLTKCLLTKSLSPVRMDDFDCKAQPIWIHNPFAEHLNFEFDSITPNMQVLTHRVFVERGTSAPLFVKFRPTISEANITLKVPNFVSNQNTFTLTAFGTVDKNIDINSYCPKNDVSSEYIPYMLSESLIYVNMKRYSELWRHIYVINNSDKCVEFRWLPYNSPPNYALYTLKDFIDFTIYPEIVIVAPRSKVQCSIHFASKEHKCILKTIPVFCEVHRPLTDSMKVARREVTDIESVDEPRYFECTRIASLFLTFDIIIEKYPKFPIFDKNKVMNLFSSSEIQTEPKKLLCCEEDIDLGLENKEDEDLIGGETENVTKIEKIFNPMEFEKILWDYIFSNSFLNLVGPLQNNFYE